MYLKENIKLLRKRKKRSQEEVSASLGITRSAYNSYENGVAEPGINILLKLSDFYQVNIDKLIRIDLSTIAESQLTQLEKGFDLDDIKYWMPVDQYICGVEHAIFFGVIGAILNIIPYVGPFIGALLPMSYALLTMDNLLSPLLILGAYQAIQLLEGNYLTPKIVGSQVNLNAFMTFLGLLLGASVWGVAGMILIIPILAILREIFDLSSSTKPFALLLGEEPKATAPKPTPDENSNS